jgi:Protein of unknown function (DUF2911)
MLKKILIGVGVVVILLAGAMAYLNYQNYSKSPRGKAELTNGDLSVSVAYCRPSVRGRLIFGTSEQGALQPHGAYWRLGANEATEITLSKDANFNGVPLKAGTYILYAVPNETGFTVYVNTAIGRWGYFEADHELDVLKTDVTAEVGVPAVEQYTISLAPAESGMNLLFEWADRKWAVSITQP